MRMAEGCVLTGARSVRSKVLLCVGVAANGPTCLFDRSLCDCHMPRRRHVLAGGRTGDVAGSGGVGIGVLGMRHRRGHLRHQARVRVVRGGGDGDRLRSDVRHVGSNVRRGERMRGGSTGEHCGPGRSSVRHGARVLRDVDVGVLWRAGRLARLACWQAAWLAGGLAGCLAGGLHGGRLEIRARGHVGCADVDGVAGSIHARLPVAHLVRRLHRHGRRRHRGGQALRWWSERRQLHDVLRCGDDVARRRGEELRPAMAQVESRHWRRRRGRRDRALLSAEQGRAEACACVEAAAAIVW